MMLFNENGGWMKKYLVLASSLIVFGGTQAMAKDIRFDRAIGQSDFKQLAREAGAAISYKRLAPADPLGLTGFDAGVELSTVDIKSHSNYWQAAFGEKAPSYLFIPSLRARKGLPWSIDVGAMYSYVPDSNIKLYGFEVSKAILDGTFATPALGLRGTYTRLAGVGDLDLQTAGIDATISKGVLFLSPYAGAGAVWVEGKAKGNLQRLSFLQRGTYLKTEDFWQPRYFAGVKISPLPLLDITAEAEYQERPTYSLKLGVGF
jgi:hypothetical protein